MTKPSITTKASLIAALAATTLSAQPDVGGDTKLEAQLSWVGAADLDEAGVAGSEIEMRTYQASASESFNYGSGRYSIGVSAMRRDIETDAVVPLPDTLDSLSLDLTGHWRLDEKWSLNARVSTGFYGDDEVSTSDALNVSGLFLGIRKLNPQWTLYTGLRVDLMSDVPVLPLAGARYQPNEQWVFNLGLPRTEAAYNVNPSLSFFGGMAFDSDTYKVDDRRVAAFNGSPVDGETTLEFLDIRVSTGVRYALTPYAKLQAEIGAVVVREWEYEDRNVEFEPDTAPYAAVSLVFEF